MTTSTALICLALVALAGAAPTSLGGINAPRCSTQCSIASSKMSYIPTKTYIYTYTGKSDVELKGTEGAVVDNTWSSKVALTWLTPCDLAITYTETQDRNGPAAEALKKYPMMVAINDGRIQHICSHPDDEPWAINIKKGVASAIQNSLPTFSMPRLHSNITETDVVGKCPTQYEVQQEGSQVVVIKEKNHRYCKERYSTPAENKLSWLQAPLPVQESWSKCKQEVNNGIFKSITCEDHNVVKAVYGAYKYAEAKQVSTLRYQSITDNEPNAISKLSGVRLRQRSLAYDHHKNEPKNNEQLVQQLEQILNLVCQKTKDMVERDAATLMAHAIQIMRHVPHTTLPEILQKIRSKQLCPDNKKMESLFLDSIAFAQEAGSVKIMVDEIVSGRVNGGRTALYTGALFLLPRPCIHVVDALKPLLQSNQPSTTTKLAAASIVHRYCRQNPQCHQQSQVQQIIEAITNNIRSQCSSSSTRPHIVQTELKVLANIGVLTQEATNAVINCMETSNPNTKVRVTAAQTFRLAKCHHPTTERLIRFALDPAETTEVRISAYLAAIPCAQYEDLQKIVQTISPQLNTQVRGFILSHLHNLQQSHAPQKQILRYNLTNILVPQDFEVDIRKYSRNIDLSYWSPILGIGAGLESDIIYRPGSFIPHLLNFNWTATLDGTPLNIGELGAHIQGLEPIFVKAFGPDGYFTKSTYEKILQDALEFMQQNWHTIQEEFENFRQRRSVDSSIISRFLSNIYGDQPIPTQADIFARFMGQEFTFVSMAGDLKHFDVTAFIRELIDNILEMMPSLSNISIDTGRVVDMNVKYDLPTIQGTPLKLQLNTTVVAGLKAQSNIPSLLQWPHGNHRINIAPSVSLQTDGFIGFDVPISTVGIRTKNTVSTANGVAILVSSSSDQALQVEIDIPNKMELIDVESDTYLMRRKGNQPEARVNPSSMRDERITKKDCITKLEAAFGIKLCYDLDVPNIIRSNDLPLVSRPVITKIRLEKSSSDMKGYKMALAVQDSASGKTWSGKISTKSSTPKEVNVMAEYKKEQGQYIAAIKVQSPVITGKINGRFVNEESQKAIETYMELQTSNMQLTKGAKIDLTRSLSSGYNKEYDLKVLVSSSQQFSPQSVIFETKYKQKDESPKIEMEVMATTKNALRQFIPFDYQLSGDIKLMTRFNIPVPIKLKNYEFQVNLVGLKVNSFVRQTEESSNKLAYSSSFKISHESQEFVSLQATQSIEGNPRQNMIATASSTLKVGRGEYKGNYRVEDSQSKSAASVQLISTTNNKKILVLDTLYQKSQPWTVQFMVESDLVAQGIKFEVKAAEQSANKYMTKIDLKHAGRDLMLVQGPVTVILLPQVTQLETELTINNDKRLNTKLVSENNKIVLSLHLEKNQQPMFLVEWDSEAGSSQGATVSAKMLVPKLYDSTMNLVVKQNVLHASVNMNLLPQTDRARRIKAFTDINLDSKQLQADLQWDADRDRNKKLSVQAQVTSYSSNPLQATVQSEVVWVGQNYGVKLNLVPGNLIISSQGPSSLQVEVTTPSHQTHTVHTQINLQQQTNQIRVESHTTYKNPANMQYIVSNRITLEKSTGPYGFKVDSQLEYTSPQGQKSSLNMHAGHQSSSQERIIESKVTAKTPRMNKPVEVEVRVTNEECSYKIKVQTDVRQAATLFNWHLEIFPEGEVKTFDTAIDMRAIHDILYAAMQMTGSQTTSMNRDMQPKLFKSRYHRPDASTHEVLIQTPRRSIEGNFKKSPSELSLEVYPNRIESENKYEASVRSSYSYTGSRHEGRIRHPELSKDMTAHVELASYGTSQQGSFELDVLPDTADKITGTITSALIANNTVRIGVDLHARMLMGNPRVKVETSWSPSTKAIEFIFHKTPSSPSSLTMVARYDQITQREASVAMLVKEEQRRVIDFAGVIKRRLLPHSNGLWLNSTLQTSIIGDHEIGMEIAKPALITLFTRRPQASNIYISKLGVKLPSLAGFSIVKANRFRFDKRPISLLELQLDSPTRLKMKIGGNYEEATELMEFIQNDAERVWTSVETWVREVYNKVREEAQQKRVPFPTPEMIRLISQINNELTQIQRELRDTVLRPLQDAINHFFHYPSVLEIKQVALWVWSSFIQMQDTYTTSVENIIKKMTNEFSNIKNFIIQGVAQAAEWIKSNQRSELLHQLLRTLQESNLIQTLNEAIVIPFQSAYPEAYRTVQQMSQLYQDELNRDIERARQFILSFRGTKTLIDSVVNTVSNEEVLMRQLARNFTSRLLRITTGVEGDDRSLTLIIPLYRPLYSLTQIPQALLKEPLKMIVAGAVPGDIVYTSITDTYFKWMPPRQLLPPFNATAVIVDGTEIFTYDGAYLRAPQTNCKILLTSIRGVADIHMSHPQSTSLPEITFQAGQVRASISTDFVAKLNGNVVNGEKTIPPVTVRVTRNKIEVVSPLLGLQMLKDDRVIMVNVSRWAFNYTQGLLGSYDAEAANDWSMRNGRNASSLQQLVNSWQEQPSCQTPDIKPIDPANVPMKRYLQCRGLFFLVKGCHPLVRKTPFLMQCYKTDNVCRSVSAYKQACAAEGYITPVPGLCLTN